jgi:hypothetical protein
MAEASQIVFKFPELAEILVTRQDIHEGHWGIFLRFGLAATNVNSPTGDLLPSAIVPVIEIGIQRFDEPNNLTVNAAEVNPKVA